MESLELIPAGGAIAGLVAVIGYLVRSNHTDRKQASERIDAANRRANAADKRADAARAAEDDARALAREAVMRADRLELEVERLRRPPQPPEGGLP